ncbi:MAG: VTT domain-containing protein [Acidithiobacillales bacterium]
MNELVAALSRYGVLLVFANVLVEQLGAPVPAIPTLVLAGALAADGRLSLAGLVLVSVVASLLGDSVWYLLGRRHGYRVLRMLCRLSLSPESCVRQTESVFDRWGLLTLLVAKFVPGLSTVAPPLAGSGRVGIVPFLSVSAAGAFLWAAFASGLGWLFHGTVNEVVGALATLGGGALAVLGGAFLLFLGVKWRQRRRFFKQLRMARIPVGDLRRLMEGGGEPLVIDVRSAGARARDPWRIPRAVVLDPDDLERQIPLLSTEREIVLYCT